MRLYTLCVCVHINIFISTKHIKLCAGQLLYVNFGSSLRSRPTHALLISQVITISADKKKKRKKKSCSEKSRVVSDIWRL